MRQAPRDDDLPEGWVQFAEPSSIPGIDVAHYRAGSYESEYVLERIMCLSFITKQANICEARRSSGRWEELNIFSSSITCLPAGHGEHVRWDGHVEAINIFIESDWLCGKDGLKLASELPILTRARYGINDKLTKRMFVELLSDNAQHAPFGASYGESLVLSTLFRLNGILVGDREEGRQAYDVRCVRRAMDHVFEAIDTPLSLRALADVSGFSGSLVSFARLFKRHTGSSVHRYIMEARLTRAKDLLLAGRSSVTDVALSCGFQNLSHFSSAFKTRWATSPSSLITGSARRHPDDASGEN